MNNSRVTVFHRKPYKVETISGPSLPDDLLAFRKKIYGDEMGYLTDQTLASKDDRLGTNLVLSDSETGKILAALHVYEADQGEFAEHSGLDSADLKLGVTITRIMVDPGYRKQNLMSLIVYLGLRQSRLWGRKHVFMYVVDGPIAALKVFDYKKITYCNKRHVTGVHNETHEFVGVTQSIHESTTRTYSRLSADQKSWLQDLLGDEAVATVEKRLATFMQGPWFAAVRTKNLSLNQYASSLRNMHQFVRLTTRMLGRAIANSVESELRSHFIEHLSGEIDHEVMIERDLKHLGIESDYLINSMVPNVETQKFMVIQESLLDFYRDPSLFIAVPFSIEGFTAKLDQEFIGNLNSCVASWGISAPKKATTFLTSHIVTDGGEDGHWVQNIKTVKKLINSEVQLQKFLNVVHMTVDSLNECYSSYILSEPKFTVTTSKTLTQNEEKSHSYVSPQVAEATY